MITRRFSQRRHLGFTIVELMVVIALLATLVALLVVAVGKVRDAAALAQSTNNLRQIGIAFHDFHNTTKRLPYNGTAATYTWRGRLHGGPALPADRDTGSWAFMILPYIDQEAMFAKKDTHEGVAVFICPGRGRPVRCTTVANPGAWTDYYINSFLNDPGGDPNARDNRRTLVSITDGTSQTIAVGHGQVNPKDYSATATIPGFTQIIFAGGSSALCRPNLTVVNGRDSMHPPSVPGNWGGPFAQGSLMAMADGSTRVFPYKMAGGVIWDGESEESTFGSFLTPTGGELGAFPAAGAR